MFRRLILLLALTLCFLCGPAASYVRADAWGDAYNSSCQLVGATGFVVAEDRDNFYILTAGHVVYDADSGYKTYKQKLWGTWYFNGRQSAVFWPKVLFAVCNINYENGLYDDLAVLSVQRSWFDNNSLPYPTVLRLVPRGWDYREGTQFVTFGHPGSWLTGFSGIISDVHHDYFIIDPTPLSGRSGSALVSTNSMVLGIVLSSNGGCISSEHIYELLENNGSYSQGSNDYERNYLRRLRY